MSGSKHAIRALLCDIDGTLVDSNDAHALAWVDAFERVRRTTAFEVVRPLIGMGGDNLLRALDVDPDSDLGAEITEAGTRIFLEKYLPAVRAFPRVRELLQRVADSGRGVYAATSAGDRELSATLERAGIADLFHDAATSDDAAASKPAPDIVNAALARARCLPSEAIMLGDTPYDVHAATRANVKCIAVRCGGWNDEALRGAFAVYADPAALLVGWNESLLR